jgi:hypothetical protein
VMNEDEEWCSCTSVRSSEGDRRPGFEAAGKAGCFGFDRFGAEYPELSEGDRSLVELDNDRVEDVALIVFAERAH